MSLFKVRDFWSFDLNKLPTLHQVGGNSASEAPTTTTTTTTKDDEIGGSGNFVVALGSFNSIGRHDVFVCADLSGFICIIQVPESEQIGGGKSNNKTEQDKSPSHETTTATTSSSSSSSITNDQKPLPIAPDETINKAQRNDIKDRQLLAAKSLGFPIVDVKCGYFTSALKQSIAVLGFDKLLVYQVKRHQVDLLSAASSGSSSQTTPAKPILDENLLSHEFEEHYRLDLLAHEFASNILVLENHADSSLTSSSISVSRSTNSTDLANLTTLPFAAAAAAAVASSSSAFGGSSSNQHHHHHHHHHHHTYKESSRSASKQLLSVQQLHLPQRDTIVVQYTNQFLFTLIDHKKIVGHFNISDPSIEILSSTSNNDSSIKEAGAIDSNEGGLDQNHIQQLARYVGQMPAAFFRDTRGSSLVISLSDNKVYCLPISKLTTLAKQNVMKRVAQNLLHGKKQENQLVDTSETTNNDRRSSLSFNQHDGDSSVKIGIKIDLNSISDWSFELACAPVQILAIQRQVKPFSGDYSKNISGNNDMTTTASNVVTSSQLLVMSRYNLDLFSNLGHHLWSQRFETSLICMHSYIIADAGGGGEQQKQAIEQAATKLMMKTSNKSNNNVDRMLTLLCSDCLSANKCNLLILDEDRIAWSALVNSKPVQLWRANLSKTFGILATLDIGQCHLSTSYLGTNLENNDDELYSEAQSSCQELAQMELLDDNIDLLSKVSCKDGGEGKGESEGEEDDDDDDDSTLNKIDLTNNLRSATSGYEQRKLQVDIRLEASNQWPNVCVESKINLLPNSSSVLQNIVVIMEFDDLICFEPTNQTINLPIVPLSSGVVQVSLGNCWPDRREPMSLSGRFSLRSSSSSSSSSLASKGGNLINFETHSTIADASRDAAAVAAAVGGGENLLPKTLQVKLYFKFNEAHSSASLQEESFLLPLNIFARLVHIDYSSGQNQSLEDVQANLNPYKRISTSNFNNSKTRNPGGVNPPYYLSDLLVSNLPGTQDALIEFLDEIIESDLVCRGLNSESLSYKQQQQLQNDEQRKEKKLSTLENINLLAQSLDCRLKYKSFSPSTTSSPTPATAVTGSGGSDLTGTIVRQSSEEYSPAVLVSIALKVPNGAQLINGIVSLSSASREGEDQATIVWIHLCDLAADSVIPEEIIKQHLTEWKIYENDDNDENLSINNHNEGQKPILVSIECDFPIPVLFIQNHLLERLRKRIDAAAANSNKISSFCLNPLTESIHDKIQINYLNLLKTNHNFLAISVNFHDKLRLLLRQYETILLEQFTRLKDELRKEYYKFHVATSSSLSLSKRLFNLPDHMHKQFTTITRLTQHYQLNLMRILSELETLKRLDYQYSKIPSADDILIESYSDTTNSKSCTLSRWPKFEQRFD